MIDIFNCIHFHIITLHWSTPTWKCSRYSEIIAAKLKYVTFEARDWLCSVYTNFCFVQNISRLHGIPSFTFQTFVYVFVVTQQQLKSFNPMHATRAPPQQLAVRFAIAVDRHRLIILKFMVNWNQSCLLSWPLISL